MYLVLPFSFNSFRFEAETNLFASLLISNTLSSTLIQEHSSLNLDDPRASKALLYRHIFDWKVHAPKEILNEICKIWSNILLECWNIWSESCKLFPDLRIRLSKVEKEASELVARMNHSTVRVKSYTITNRKSINKYVPTLCTSSEWVQKRGFVCAGL